MRCCNDTIRKNSIQYGNLEVTEQEAKEAVALAQIEACMESPPDGWDTVVAGERKEYWCFAQPRRSSRLARYL